MLPTGHKVSPDRLEEFRRIYKETYGEEITPQQATEMTDRLVALYKLLLRPLPDAPAQSSLPQPPPAQSAPEVS